MATRKRAAKVARKVGRKVSRAAAKVTRKVKTETYKCQICAKEHNNPLDAATHLMDHGASALESISTMIKNQKEGRVSEEDRMASSGKAKTKESSKDE